MKLRVVPSALSLTLSGGCIPGLIAVTPAPAAAAKSAYAMTDLGNLGGGISLGFGINASGEVVGRSYLDKVFFLRCGKHTQSAAYAINDNGQIVASGSNAKARSTRSCSPS